jgi:hypothetical protein
VIRNLESVAWCDSLLDFLPLHFQLPPMSFLPLPVGTTPSVTYDAPSIVLRKYEWVLESTKNMLRCRYL